MYMCIGVCTYIHKYIYTYMYIIFFKQVALDPGGAPANAAVQAAPGARLRSAQNLSWFPGGLEWLESDILVYMHICTHVLYIHMYIDAASTSICNVM